MKNSVKTIVAIVLSVINMLLAIKGASMLEVTRKNIREDKTMSRGKRIASAMACTLVIDSTLKHAEKDLTAALQPVTSRLAKEIVKRKEASKAIS